MDSELSVRIVEDDADFQALEGEWNALWSACKGARLSQGFSWCRTAWTVCNAPFGRSLYLVTARRGSRLVGIWPLVRQPSRRGGLGDTATLLSRPLHAEVRRSTQTPPPAGGFLLSWKRAGGETPGGRSGSSGLPVRGRCQVLGGRREDLLEAGEGREVGRLAVVCADHEYVATRYDKLADDFLAGVFIAATVSYWPK